MTEPVWPLPSRIEIARRLAALVGLVGLAVSTIGWFFRPHQFFRSYLVAFLFWTTLALGCLVVTLLHRLTGGAWGDALQRILAAGAGTFPLLAVLFVPVAVSVREIYPWAAGAARYDALLVRKAGYLNVPFFVGRAVFFFVVWIALAEVYNRWAARLEASADPALGHRLRNLAGGGLVAMVLTVTFAAVDWAMSLEPHWFSTIYGLIFLVGGALAAFAFAIATLAWLAREEPRVLGKAQAHDLGKLLFAFVMLWAYVNFSQFLIVWSANLPEEVPWYARRFAGGWQWLALVIVVCHLILPFFLLLSRDLKRDTRRLGLLALGLLAARLIDLYWLVAPATDGRSGLAVHWLDFAVTATIGGLWLALFFSRLGRRPPWPIPASAPAVAVGLARMEAV
jgi:hypothetical protein